MKSAPRSRRGAEGELCIAGPSVLQGYWNLPENTAKAFLPGRDIRWYRTGDIVVELPDGNYKFLGRRDRMIKKRGYRIELGEIEVALYRHPAIKEAAVLAFPDDDGVPIKAFASSARRIEAIDHRAKEILFRESAALHGSRPLLLLLSRYRKLQRIRSITRSSRA